MGVYGVRHVDLSMQATDRVYGVQCARLGVGAQYIGQDGGVYSV